jgi:ribose transport system substrate-binding protein
MENNAAYTVQSSGSHKYDYVSADFTADKMQSGTQSMISAGINGLMYYGAFPSLTPTIIEMCESAKVPFVMHDQIPHEDQQKALLESSYFVGYIGADGYSAGYQLGEQAAKDGYKTALEIGGTVGDPTHDKRIQGFKDAFEAGGGTVLGAARCVSPAEGVQKASDLLTAYDAGCLYSATGAYTFGALTAMDNFNEHMFVYTTDTDPDLLDFIRNGEMVGDCGAVVATMLSYTLLQNYLDGHPIVDKDGKAPFISTLKPLIVTPDTADLYLKYLIDDHPLTPEAIQSFLWRYNPDISYQDYIDFFSNYSFDTLMQLKGDK